MHYHGTPFVYDHPHSPRTCTLQRDWNALIGFHFTPHLPTAQRFARGLHRDPLTRPTGRVITLPHLPTRTLHLLNEHHLDDTLTLLALRAGLTRNEDLHLLWDYSPDEAVDVTLYSQTVAQSLREPGDYQPHGDHGHRVLSDLWNFGLPGTYDLLGLNITLAAVTLFLVTLTRRGYSAVSYLNTHEEEVPDGDVQRTLIIPFPEQVTGPVSLRRLRRLARLEHQRALTELLHERQNHQLSHPLSPLTGAQP